MGHIHVPGQPSPTNNPLLVLAAVGQQMIDPLKEIAENTRSEPRHLYALAEGREPGSWGSYCLACSDKEHEYVYPCLVHPDRLVPPSHITTLEQGVDSSQDGSSGG